MELFYVLMGLLWLRTALTADTPTVSSQEDITSINNLRDEGPRVSIDPRLRRALLRVLTRLEEEDRHSGQHTARQMAEVMQNIITEEDFIKYFQEQGLEKDLLESFAEKPEDQKKYPEEILSYSSEDKKEEPSFKKEEPFTFASYPEDHKNDDTTSVSVNDVPKFPSTNPTPSLGDAIYFQIPEPLEVPTSTNEEDDKTVLSTQETRSIQGTIQGPTLVSPAEDQYRVEKEEVKVSFIPEDQSTKEIVQDNQLFIRVAPEKNEVSDEGGKEEESAKVEVDFHASNGTEVEDADDAGNSSTTAKPEKHEVEFLHSSLLAAFTVQQDQQGLPRRVIPLNYQSSGDPIPLPNNKFQQSSQEVSVEEKQRKLQEQVKFLQEQQLQEEQYQRLQEFVKQRQRLLEEESQRQALLENQRLVLARQRQQQILFQSQQQDSQLQALKELERQRLYQQNFQQNFQQTPQNIQFQKSVDFQFQNNVQQPQPQAQRFNAFQPSFNSFHQPFPVAPSVELNRVNRHEPSNFIGNFGLSTPQPNINFRSHSARSTVQPFFQAQPTQPTYIQPSNFIQNPSPTFQHRFAPPNYLQRPTFTVDGQIQNLLSISGIARPAAQEDLNIVSKVLALGHGNYQPPRQQLAASSAHEVIVDPPSRVIEPPKPST